MVYCRLQANVGEHTEVCQDFIDRGKIPKVPPDQAQHFPVAETTQGRVETMVFYIDKKSAHLRRVRIVQTPGILQFFQPIRVSRHQLFKKRAELQDRVLAVGVHG